MVNVKINGIDISVQEGTTILEAARQAGIKIPTLCYLENVSDIGACRVCVVEVEGIDRCVTACNNVVEEGMVIYTNSKKARLARRTNVQLILSQHDFKCASCVRNTNCALQDLASELNIREVPFKELLEKEEWDKNFPLIRDSEKCIKCMRCVQTCDKVQQLHVWDVHNTGGHTTVGVRGNQKISDVNCSLCGQCITHCPVGALRARDDVERVYEALEDPDMITVVQPTESLMVLRKWDLTMCLILYFQQTLQLWKKEANSLRDYQRLKNLESQCLHHAVQDGYVLSRVNSRKCSQDFPQQNLHSRCSVQQQNLTSLKKSA